MADLALQVARWIATWVAGAETVTTYRAPLVAWARADDPRFAQLAARVPGHLRPTDLLPGARSVCAYFLPFQRALVSGNSRAGGWASEGWARAYVETNALLEAIAARLAAALADAGIRAAWQAPTHNFDPVRLVSAWSHKSVAAIAGLGGFGHHHMLITARGCAGRIGSLVLDAEVPATAPLDQAVCAFDRGCRVCIERCPAGALTEAGLDRARCYARCLENDARYPWLADVCGLCATGPCATRAVPVRRGDGEA